MNIEDRKQIVLFVQDILINNHLYETYGDSVEIPSLEKAEYVTEDLLNKFEITIKEKVSS